MIRTQVQLTEEQARALREAAARRQVSLAELVRQGVERILAEDTLAERYRRASTAIGRFSGEATDVSEQHDRYLEEAYR
jgi:Arc/MetJ-type ribon-helix-helix transcriptional regulator